jgi:hypothetical protein
MKEKKEIVYTNMDRVTLTLKPTISLQAFDQIVECMGISKGKVRKMLTELIAMKGLRESSMFVWGSGNQSSAWDIIHTDRATYEICAIYTKNNRIINLNTGEVRCITFGSKPTQRRFAIIMEGDNVVTKEPNPEESEDSASEESESTEESNG